MWTGMFVFGLVVLVLFAPVGVITVKRTGRSQFRVRRKGVFLKKFHWPMQSRPPPGALSVCHN